MPDPSYYEKPIDGEKLEGLIAKVLQDSYRGSVPETVASALVTLARRIDAVEDAVNSENIGDRIADSFDSQSLKAAGEDVLTRHQAVTDSNPTLSWGTKSTVGTVGSTGLHVTMPSNPATGKQDVISDLSTIRSGAAKGATSVQPADLAPYAVASDVETALAGKQDVISDLSTIRSGASAGATAVQPETMQAALDKSSDVIVTYNTEENRTHKYWKFASATFSGNSRYMFSEWDVILQTNLTYYPFKLIFEAYKISSSAISIRYAKIVDVKSGTSESALGATEFYVKTQDGTSAPLIIELWCGFTRDSKSSIAIKEFRAGLASSSNNPIATRNNSWTYYPNDGNTTTSETKPVTGDGYTVTQFTQMSDKFAYYAERIGKPSTTDGNSVVTSQVGSKSIPVYVKSDGSIDECDVKSTYIPTGDGSDAPVNGKALAAALAGGTASAATATALNMGQLGNDGRPVYIGSDGKPKLCDADIAVFIAEYVPNGTSTPFASILTAYNSGRAIILKTSFCYLMLNGVSLSSGGDITSFAFEGFTGNYIQDFSVNSNNVWAYHAIPLTLSSQGAPNGALGSQTNPLSIVYSTSFVGDVTGKADSADKINTDAGSHTRPVYFKNGIPELCNSRFIYSVDASGNYSSTQYKLCVGSIGTAPNTFYFT